MSHLVLAVPAFLGSLLLVWHSWRCRGPRITLLFVALCIAWYVPKEYAIYRKLFAEHTYLFSGNPLTVAHVPIAVPIGYVFAASVSWLLAEKVTARLRSSAGRLYPVVVVWLMVTSGIAYLMETTGTSAGWWYWEKDGRLWSEWSLAERIEENSGTIHPAIPYAPVYGWAIYMLPFAVLFLGLNFTTLSRLKWKPLVYLGGFGGYFLICLKRGPGIMLGLLFLLSLFSGTELSPATRPIRREGLTGRLLPFAPLIAILLMLSTSLYVFMVHSRDPSLLVSWLPFATLLALAHAGPWMVPFGILLFVFYAIVRLSGWPPIHHSLVYLGLILLMALVRRLRAGDLRLRDLLRPRSWASSIWNVSGTRDRIDPRLPGLGLTSPARRK